MTVRIDDDAAFDVTDLNRVRRYSQRGRYDRASVLEILDRGLVAHVAFVDEGRPVVIPMAYGHDGERLFLHGARKGRIGTAAADEAVSIGVTLVDGIVVAPSLFDSSMNYRAVVIHGRASVLEARADRLHALECVVEHYVPGRWAELPLPSERELRATVVLAVEMESASAKVRRGGAVEEAERDEPAVAWSGVVPVVTTLGVPVADARVRGEVPVPESVRRLAAGE